MSASFVRGLNEARSVREQAHGVKAARLPAPPSATGTRQCVVSADSKREVEAMQPSVVHVDEALIVVHKPPGLLAVPGRQVNDSVWARLACDWPDARIVHRLDQATSGLMLFARGAAVQRQLSIAFASQGVHKTYEAVVHGLINDAQGLIDAPLAADWPNRPRQRIDATRGKPSRTIWRVALRDTAAVRTRVRLEPTTGRTHQLRVHLASIGHAIVGDALYGPETSAQEPRLLLHATRLSFVHPTHGTMQQFHSPAPF
jgi:tRNA pseudouridine32 synthase/23S rRNA pseudouridine746 synthase